MRLATPRNLVQLGLRTPNDASERRWNRLGLAFAMIGSLEPAETGDGRRESIELLGDVEYEHRPEAHVPNDLPRADGFA